MTLIRLLPCGLLILIAGSACAGREHLSPDFGERSRMFYARQRVSADAAQGSPAGLDTEEAAAIRDRHRESMEPEAKGQHSDNLSRVLVLEDSDNEKKQQ